MNGINFDAHRLMKLTKNLYGQLIIDETNHTASIRHTSIKETGKSLCFELQNCFLVPKEYIRAEAKALAQNNSFLLIAPRRNSTHYL